MNTFANLSNFEIKIAFTIVYFSGFVASSILDWGFKKYIRGDDNVRKKQENV